MEIQSVDNASVNNSLLENQLGGLKKFADASGTINQNLSESEKRELSKAARGFEAIFLNMMLKEMKKGMLDESSNKEGDLSFGSDTLNGYTDMLFTDELSKKGTGIGIAEMIYSQLSGGDKLKPITEINFSEATAVSSSDNSKDINNMLSSITNKYDSAQSSFSERVSSRLEKYQSIISEASEKYNVPQEIIKAVITAESAGRYDAKSPVGAKGLMQLMDGTAKDLGVTNSYDPEQNIMGGTKYISQMISKFGNIDEALAAYNAGPGNVEKYNGIPPFSETQNYVNKVKNYIAKYQA